MNLLNRLLGVVFTLIDRYRGVATVTEIKQSSVSLGSLEAYSISGYHIVMHCYKRQYRRSYDKSQTTGTYHSVFDVSCSVSPDAPEILKKACSITVSFPPLVPEFLSDDCHKRAAINAYLDMIRVELTAEHFVSV